VDEDPQSGEYVLHPTKPAWEEEGWADAWRERTAHAVSNASTGTWRSVLVERIHIADRIAEIDGKIKDKSTERIIEEVRRMFQALVTEVGAYGVPGLEVFQQYLSTYPEEVEKLRTMLEVPNDVAMMDFLATQTLAEIYAKAQIVN
jgi:hypothetical protein